MTILEAKRLDEAAEWMLRLRDEASDEVVADWLRWCEADRRNQRSFDKVQELWRLSEGLASEVAGGELAGPAQPLSSPELARRRHAVEPAGPDVQMLVESQAVRTIDRLAAGAGGRSARVRTRLVALAAGVALAVTGVLWLQFGAVNNNSVIAADAPVRSATLPDGSRVELAAKSTVAVRYTDALRGVELRKGEAWFSVAPNKEIPFVVDAGSVRVRAIGTAFNVRRAGERVVITVTEGSVDVQRKDDASRTLLSAGKQLAVTTDEAPAPAVTIDPATALAWREGRLEYVGEPLEAVIADINRYATRPVVIADDSSKRLRFSGTVMIGYTNEWVRALPGEFPVRVTEQNGVDVIQSAR